MMDLPKYINAVNGAAEQGRKKATPPLPGQDGVTVPAIPLSFVMQMLCAFTSHCCDIIIESIYLKKKIFMVEGGADGGGSECFAGCMPCFKRSVAPVAVLASC